MGAQTSRAANTGGVPLHTSPAHRGAGEQYPRRLSLPADPMSRSDKRSAMASPSPLHTPADSTLASSASSFRGGRSKSKGSATNAHDGGLGIGGAETSGSGQFDLRNDGNGSDGMESHDRRTRRWSLPATLLRGRRRSVASDTGRNHSGDLGTSPTASGFEIGNPPKEVESSTDIGRGRMLPTTASDPSRAPISPAADNDTPPKLDDGRSGTLGRLRSARQSTEAMSSSRSNSVATQSASTPSDINLSLASLGIHSASLDRMVGRRPHSPDFSPAASATYSPPLSPAMSPTLSPSPSTHMNDTESANTSSSNIDELTTLVAFGVVLPSLSSAVGGALPLSASPAYISRYSDQPQSAPSSPKLSDRSSSGRGRSGSFSGGSGPADSSWRDPVRRHRSGSFGSSGAGESPSGNIAKPDLTPPVPASRRHTITTSTAISNTQQQHARSRSPSPTGSPPASPQAKHRQVQSLSGGTHNRRRSLPSRLHPPSPLHQAHSPPRRAPSPDEAETSTNPITLELPAFERLLKSRMSPQVFLKGEMIIKKHDVGKEMYFLSKGKVEVVSGDGRSRYGVIEEGSFFGELGVLFDIPRTASVRALQNCYCMRLTRIDLETAMQPFPFISERFRAVVAERMVEVQKKRSDRGGKGTLKRLDFVPNVGRVVEVAKEEEDAP